MRIFSPPIEIAEDEGFTADKDIFRWRDFGERLTNLVTEVDGPFVMLLDAPWGAGKTTFVKMWRGHLRRRGIPSIYIDAFASDFVESALTMLVGEVLQLADERLQNADEQVKAFKDKAVRVVKVLGLASVKLGVKAATLGALDAADLEKLSIREDIADEMEKITDSLVRNDIENYKQQHAMFGEFRTALAELAEKLCEDERSSEPVVFVIDELDRCKPNFALNVIETIKHLYSVPGLVFVLVTHLNQLKNSVTAAYGSGIDTTAYLEKFYHLRMHLPDATFRNSEFLRRFLDHVFLDFPDDGRGGAYVNGLKQRILAITERKELTLRRIERIAAYAGVLLASAGPNRLRQANLVTGLCVIKVIDPDLYSQLRIGGGSYEEVSKCLGLNLIETDKQKPEIDLWQLCMGEAVEDEARLKLSMSLAEYELDERQVIRFLCSLIDGFEFPSA